MEIMIPSFTYLSGLYWNELMDINELIGNTKIWAFLIHFLYIFVCSAPWITFLSTQFNLIWPKEWFFFFFNSSNLTFRVGWSSNSDGFVKNFSSSCLRSFTFIVFSLSQAFTVWPKWPWIPLDLDDMFHRRIGHVPTPKPISYGFLWLVRTESCTKASST